MTQMPALKIWRGWCKNIFTDRRRVAGPKIPNHPPGGWDAYDDDYAGPSARSLPDAWGVVAALDYLERMAAFVSECEC